MAQAPTFESMKSTLKLVKPKNPPKDAPKTRAHQSTRVTAMEDGINLNRKDGGYITFQDISMLVTFQLDSDPDTWYIDLFVYGHAFPFRLSQKAINYRQFLPQVAQRSKDNFTAFLLYLLDQIDSVYIDDNTLEFLKTGKIVGYPDFQLFEEYTRRLWFQLISWMKFHCEKCGEVYWVDESKVTEQGAKTKCIKCQNIITVKKRPKPVPLKEKDKRKTVSCPHCHYENPEGSQFCTMCQKPLVTFESKTPHEPHKQADSPPSPATEKKEDTKKAPAAPPVDLSHLPLQARDTSQFSRSLREISMSLQEDIDTLDNPFAWFTKFSWIMQALGFLFFAGGMLTGIYIYFVLPDPAPPEVLSSATRLTYAGISVAAGFLLSLACIIVSNIIALTLQIERNTKVTSLLVQRLISKMG